MRSSPSDARRAAAFAALSAALRRSSSSAPRLLPHAPARERSRRARVPSLPGGGLDEGALLLGRALLGALKRLTRVAHQLLEGAQHVSIVSSCISSFFCSREGGASASRFETEPRDSAPRLLLGPQLAQLR